MQGRCDNDPLDAADDICEVCAGEFCQSCLIHMKGRKNKPVCKKCAIDHSGVRGGVKTTRKTDRRSAKKRRKALQEKKHERASQRFVFFDEDGGGFELPNPETVKPAEPENIRRRKVSFGIGKKNDDQEQEAAPNDTDGEAVEPEDADPSPADPSIAAANPTPSATELLARLRQDDGPSFSTPATELPPPPPGGEYASDPFMSSTPAVTEPTAVPLAVDHSVDPFALPTSETPPSPPGPSADPPAPGPSVEQPPAPVYDPAEVPTALPLRKAASQPGAEPTLSPVEPAMSLADPQAPPPAADPAPQHPEVSSPLQPRRPSLTERLDASVPVTAPGSVTPSGPVERDARPMSPPAPRPAEPEPTPEAVIAPEPTPEAVIAPEPTPEAVIAPEPTPEPTPEVVVEPTSPPPETTPGPPEVSRAAKAATPSADTDEDGNWIPPALRGMAPKMQRDAQALPRRR